MTKFQKLVRVTLYSLVAQVGGVFFLPDKLGMLSHFESQFVAKLIV